MSNNLLLIDSDYDEAIGFIKGLREITGVEWDIGLYENNKIYGIKRYIKFFTVAFKTVINRRKYKNKLILCWQQFYGIAIAFFCRLFHVRKEFRLIIMTFIFKEKQGVLGKLFFLFIKYAITSKYVDKIILTTQGEADYYADIFDIPKSMFEFAKCGAIEYDNEEYYDELLDKNDYLFSTGRSNRDYKFLINCIKNTKYKLIIACDILETTNYENIIVYNNVFGNDMLRYMKNAKAVVISLDDDRIAAGQLVFLHAMNMGVPVIITKSIGVTNDYVVNGYNGLVIEKNESELLNALSMLENDSEMYSRLQENSVREFKENYTYFAMGKNVGKILLEFL